MTFPQIALAVALACTACTSSPTATPSASPSASPSPAATPSVSVTANPSPTSTTIPLPEQWVELESYPLRTLPPPPEPTGAPDPAVWRIEVQVVTVTGTPIEQACVAIGRRGCLRFSPRTDERGVAVIDLPQVREIEYELFVFAEGGKTGRLVLRPSGPAMFGVVIEPR